MSLKIEQGTALDIFKRALQQFFAHDMQTHTKAVTYQVLFSFFPFIIFFIALLGFFDLSTMFDLLRSQSDIFFLAETVPQLNLIFDQLQQRRHGMLSFGVVFAIWASSSAMRSMMKALNVVYGIKERRPGWKRFLISIAATLVVGVMLVVTVTLILVRPMAVQTMVQYTGINPLFLIIWTWWFRWPAILLLLTVTVIIVYWTAPSFRSRFYSVVPGALVAVFAWFLASLGFDIYVRHFAGYDHLYGNVGTAVVLLLYFFISSFIFLFGAELNAVIEYFSPIANINGCDDMGEDKYLW